MRTENFDKLVSWARDVIADPHSPTKTVIVKLSWDDYNDEVYERMVASVDYDDVPTEMLDVVPAARALERHVTRQQHALERELRIEQDGYSTEDQEEVTITVTKNTLELQFVGVVYGESKVFSSLPESLTR